MLHSPPPRLPPIRRPRAATPIPLSLGDLVQINGQTYVVGPGLIPQGAAPPPPPPPPLPLTLAGYKNASTGLTTTTAAAGDLLLLETSGLPALIPGASGRVLLGNTEATVLSWAPGEVEIKVPPMAGGPTGVKVYYQASPSANPQLLIGMGPPLTITMAAPLPPPVPSGPSPSGHVWLHHDMTPVTAAVPGEELTLLGTDFGGGTGRVWFAGIEQQIVSWTDTRIVFVLQARPSGAVRGWYAVRRADSGESASGPAPFVVKAP